MRRAPTAPRVELVVTAAPAAPAVAARVTAVMVVSVAAVVIPATAVTALMVWIRVPGVVTAVTAPGVATACAPATGAWVGQAEMFRGDLGEVRAFAGVRSLVTGSDAGDASHVRLDAEDSAAGWWAMTRLTLGGTLQHRDLRPGARLTFTGGSCPGTTLRVTALGCSGPLRDDARFDHPAEQVTVAVSAGPTASTQRMDFTASFRSPAGSQQVAGSFIYEVGVAR